MRTTSDITCNCSNDAFDAETGADVGKLESIVNLTGSRLGVLGLAFASLAAGAMMLWRALALVVRLQLILATSLLWSQLLSGGP